MKKSWWPPGAIRFTKAQVLWLLRHLSLIRLGFWPPEHKETGYAGGKGKGHGHSAPYERVVEVAAELDSRIEKCGLDGLLLEFVYSSDSDDKQWLEQHIAYALGPSPEDIEERIDTARRYISGKCPRWIDCPGAGKCVACAKCPKSKEVDGQLKCTKQPRKGRSYDSFKKHK